MTLPPIATDFSPWTALWIWLSYAVPVTVITHRYRLNLKSLVKALSIFYVGFMLFYWLI